MQQHQSLGEDGYMQDVVSPSLHNLLANRHVKLTFCASVQALLAFLTICGQNRPAHDIAHG
jgi:hypothetical protein